MIRKVLMGWVLVALGCPQGGGLVYNASQEASDQPTVLSASSIGTVQQHSRKLIMSRRMAWDKVVQELLLAVAVVLAGAFFMRAFHLALRDASYVAQERAFLIGQQNFRIKQLKLEFKIALNEEQIRNSDKNKAMLKRQHVKWCCYAERLEQSFTQQMNRIAQQQQQQQRGVATSPLRNVGTMARSQSVDARGTMVRKVPNPTHSLQVASTSHSGNTSEVAYRSDSVDSQRPFFFRRSTPDVPHYAETVESTLSSTPKKSPNRGSYLRDSALSSDNDTYLASTDRSVVQQDKSCTVQIKPTSYDTSMHFPGSMSSVSEEAEESTR